MTRLYPLFSLFLAIPCAMPVAAQDALGVFVGNQGSPASVTYVDPSDGTETQLLDGQLGGFLQGMALVDGRLYVTGNGTRIDVLDATTRQRVGQITDPDFTTARYIAPTGDGRAYVTTQTYAADATAADVVIVDLATNSVAGRIALPVTVDNSGQFPAVFGNPEGLVVVGTRAFVSQAAFGQGTEIAVIDTETDAVIGSIETGCTARYPVADGDGDVIVACAGTGEVLVIDAETEAIARRVTAPEGLTLGTGFAQDAVVAPGIGSLGTGERVYFVVPQTGIIAFDPDAHTFSDPIAVPDVDARGVTSLGVDPGRATLYLGRPDADGPFSAAGTVTAHDATGALLATYSAGVYPTFISVDLGTNTSGGPLAGGASFEVSAPSPNPAVGQARVVVTLEAPAEVGVAVYDALGREVARQAERLGAGEGVVDVALGAVPSGVYVVRVSASGETVARRLTVAR